jgi:uncharacterized protein (TIGR00369 family)
MSTAALSVRHLRPSLVENEAFVARAHTIRTGRTFTLAEVVVEDAKGRGVAHAAGSAVSRPVGSVPPVVSDPKERFQEPKYTVPDPHLRPLPPDRLSFRLLEEMDGLSMMQMMWAGTLPPQPRYELLGLRYLEVLEDTVSVALRATEWLCSRSHSVSAGVVACLVHDGLSIPVFTRCPLGQRIAILEQSASFLRAVPPDGRELLARGKLVHRGPEFLVSSVEVVDADGNRVALGSQTSVLTAGRYEEPKAERVLATVLFTDIVESTSQVRELGDERWRQLAANHDALVRRQLQIHKGREVKTTGDGFLATFESPGLAVQCARAIRDGIRRLGLDVRAGIHTGECEAIDGDVRGIAVHLAARVQAAAEPGEILVSSTVCDLVSGSGIRFVDRGLHELKGIEGKRQLFAVED